MGSDRKKIMVLACLVVFWIGLIVVQRHTGRRGHAPEATSARRATAGERETSANASQRNAQRRSAMPRLKLSRIDRVRPPFYPEGRNIFASIEPPAAMRPSLPRPAAPPTPPPPDPFVEAARKIRYLGFAETTDTAMAFIAYGEEILVIPETAEFGNVFRVKTVAEDAIIVTSLDGTKEIRLGLSPGQGDAPASSPIQRGIRP